MKKKVYLFPKTKFGELSIVFLILFFVFISIFFMFAFLGEKGGEKFFSNLKLSLTLLASSFFGIVSFICGLIGIFKDKERAVLVYLSVFVGGFVLFWTVGELFSSH